LKKLKKVSKIILEKGTFIVIKRLLRNPAGRHGIEKKMRVSGSGMSWDRKSDRIYRGC